VHIFRSLLIWRVRRFGFRSIAAQLAYQHPVLPSV
jgi:hypothetical protein